MAPASLRRVKPTLTATMHGRVQARSAADTMDAIRVETAAYARDEITAGAALAGIAEHLAGSQQCGEPVAAPDADRHALIRRIKVANEILPGAALAELFRQRGAAILTTDALAELVTMLDGGRWTVPGLGRAA